MIWDPWELCNKAAAEVSISYYFSQSRVHGRQTQEKREDTSQSSFSLPWWAIGHLYLLHLLQLPSKYMMQMQNTYRVPPKREK